MNLREPSRKNTIPAYNGKTVIRLFVYGTLKRGGWNHDRFCHSAIKIETATVWGRLFHLPAGFPALVIHESSILAAGTGDPLADAAVQADFAARIAAGTGQSHPEGDWDLVKGEIITLGTPDRELPPIDRLEGFHHDNRCMYQRVLVIAQTKKAKQPAWVYSMSEAPEGKRLQGEWLGGSIPRRT
jgi:gamma-glutamylcyclotransferase (GGCT)/AIG2-like uncharacterized protein YtfP